MKHSRKVVTIDPHTNETAGKHEKVWNYTIADLALLAFSTSFPQISLATIDSIRNMGQLIAGGSRNIFIKSIDFSNIVMGSTAPSSPCDTYLLFHGETLLSNRVRAFIYTVALSYCFIGLSVITCRFFKAMENIVKQSREVVTMDPHSNTPVVKHEKVWNYTIADISLLAFGTSFPQISLATIDAIRNMGQLTAGGYVRGERPEDWVPEEHASVDTGNDEISEDMFSVDLYHNTEYSKIPEKDMEGSPIMDNSVNNTQEKLSLVYIWWQHFVDAVTVPKNLLELDSCTMEIVISDKLRHRLQHAPSQVSHASAYRDVTNTNSVNIYVGIGVPWLIDTMYNYFVYQEPLYIDNADGLSFSLVVFFATSFGCITVLVLRRIILGAELGGPRLWAWMTSTYFMALENSEACRPAQGHCRYHPEGLRLRKKTLKERLRYNPDEALVIDSATSAPTPMDSSTSDVSNVNVVAFYLNNIEPLNGANYPDWRGKVITCLAWNDLDVALRVDKPATPANGAAPSPAFEKWERSDRMTTSLYRQLFLNLAASWQPLRYMYRLLGIMHQTLMHKIQLRRNLRQKNSLNLVLNRW
ncbi:hypothetical protein PR202_gb13001 [Eleusine coracana subsp. coracana]|uniref:Uncharacterized protein n=1 Tax=Eleusine coracana subsp. coracana TaxID=191504 RepID=A0AAV5ER16_ELECO|nr:hypothetical protein PR202_gb13001 [Eleusine coracana subsp. coracana]